MDNVIFPTPFSLGARDTKLIRLFQESIFSSATEAQRYLRRDIIPAGTKVLRNVSNRYCKTGDDARSVPPHSSTDNGNRWSGVSEDKKISQGALYTCLDPIALSNEALRYTRERKVAQISWDGAADGKAEYTTFGSPAKAFSQLLVGRLYYTFVLTKSIQIVDLTPQISSEFYDRIERSRTYTDAKKSLGLHAEFWKLVSDPIDYTASRPLGLAALLGMSADGIRVQTFQNEIAGAQEGGRNLIFGGPDGKAIKCLQPTGRLVEGLDAGLPALLEIPNKPGVPDNRVVVPGSLLWLDGK